MQIRPDILKATKYLSKFLLNRDPSLVEWWWCLIIFTVQGKTRGQHNRSASCRRTSRQGEEHCIGSLKICCICYQLLKTRQDIIWIYSMILFINRRVSDHINSVLVNKLKDVISELLQFLDLAIAHWLKKPRETSSLSSRNFKNHKSSKQGGLYPHWINQIYDWDWDFLNIYFYKKGVHDHDEILLEEEWIALLFVKGENNVCLKISKQLIRNWSKHLRTYSVPYSAYKSKGCVQNRTLYRIAKTL